MTLKKFYIFYLLLIIISAQAMSSDKKHDISHLTALQTNVTQHGGTEQPFNNEYWDNKAEGIYVDIISGKALFSSTDKYDSGTGWPSFTKPIEQNALTSKTDNTLGMSRVEVKSSHSNSHLGHVFDDGLQEKGGKRFCINSAALKFIAKEDMVAKGYAKYLYLFDNKKSQSFHEKAILAGGCFWGMEDLFANLDGVIDVVNGYSGGSIKNPTYELISSGITGHAESIEITFNPAQISYEQILRFFLKIHDPTQKNRQQNDIGTQYRSVIFYLNESQKEIARKVIEKANESGVFKKPIATEITKFNEFYKAEDYHQDYLKNNPNGYTCHSIREEWEF